MVRYLLDPGARLIDDDRVLIAGSPLSIFRLTPAGGQLVRRLIDEPAPTTLTPREHQLIDRLVDAGALHPRPPADAFVGSISVVVPVLDPTPEQLERLSSAVGRWLDDLAGSSVERIIVDDASRVPVTAPPGWSVIRRPTNGGPAAARNTGVEHLARPGRTHTSADSSSDADTKLNSRPDPDPHTEPTARPDRHAKPDTHSDADTKPGPHCGSNGRVGDTERIVIFLDLDTAPVRGAAEMVAHFDDQRVGLVAARVTSRPGPSVRERYEMWRSPLDLGSMPARVRAGTRVSYVPAAALAVRVSAFDAVGGFDTSLRFGEDVDLVWRLDQDGWRCRYEPEAVVEHQPRSTWQAWWRQRAGYGSSAAPLAARHPGALAPARVSGWTATVWSLVGAGHPVAAVAIAGGTTAALVRKLPGLRDPKREALRLAGLGHLYGGRILASAVWRAWWPFALVAAMLSRRARRAVAAAAIVPAVLDWRRDRPAIDPVRAVGLRLADDVAYGVGLWGGALREHNLAAIRPDLSNWPPKPKRSISTTPTRQPTS